MPGPYPEPHTDRLPLMGVLLTLALLLATIAGIWALTPASWSQVTDWIAPTTRLTLEDGIRLMERAR